MFKFYFRHLTYIKKFGYFMPFKVYQPTRVVVKGILNLKGRLHFGNNKLPVLSRIPANLYISQNGEANFGTSVSVGPGVNIIVKEGAKLTVGNGTYFTSDSHIEIAKFVEIGANCAISWGTTIIDSDHHQIITTTGQLKSESENVLIKDHCWIGCNVTILKGTELGENCIVAAGSVVKGKFPPNSLIAGVPGKVVKSEINWE